MLDNEKYYQVVAFRLSNEEDSISGIDALGFIDIDDFIAAGEPENYITDDKICFIPNKDINLIFCKALPTPFEKHPKL